MRSGIVINPGKSKKRIIRCFGFWYEKYGQEIRLWFLDQRLRGFSEIITEDTPRTEFDIIERQGLCVRIHGPGDWTIEGSTIQGVVKADDIKEMK
jgi:hypothetical protein